METGSDRHSEGRRLLVEACRFVSTGWSQFGDARSVNGAPVKPWSEAAVSWSLLGALVAAVEDGAGRHGEAVTIIDLAAACALLGRVVDADSLAAWNDAPERSQADVVDALMTASEADEGASG